MVLSKLTKENKICDCVEEKFDDWWCVVEFKALSRTELGSIILFARVQSARETNYKNYQRRLIYERFFYSDLSYDFQNLAG